MRGETDVKTKTGSRIKTFRLIPHSFIWSKKIHKYTYRYNDPPESAATSQQSQQSRALMPKMLPKIGRAIASLFQKWSIRFYYI